MIWTLFVFRLHFIFYFLFVVEKGRTDAYIHHHTVPGHDLVLAILHTLCTRCGTQHRLCLLRGLAEPGQVEASFVLYYIYIVVMRIINDLPLSFANCINLEMIVLLINKLSLVLISFIHTYTQYKFNLISTVCINCMYISFPFFIHRVLPFYLRFSFVYYLVLSFFLPKMASFDFLLFSWRQIT